MTHCTTRTFLESVASYDHLRQLDIADNAKGSDLDIDVLVGCDHYWSVTTGRIKQGSEGPTAMETLFGWVISGPCADHFRQEGQRTAQLVATFVTNVSRFVPPLTRRGSGQGAEKVLGTRVARCGSQASVRHLQGHHCLS